MLSIHSPDSVFIVMVSIFIENHNDFGAPSQCYKNDVLVIVTEFTVSTTAIMTY